MYEHEISLEILVGIPWPGRGVGGGGSDATDVQPAALRDGATKK